MSLPRMLLTLLALFAFSAVCRAEDAAAEKKKAEAAAKEKKKNDAELAKLDAQIKKTPDDPAPHTRRAQLLMKMERWNDGYDAAQKSMQCSIKAGDNLASIALESIELEGGFRVDVVFNMGSRERKPPEMGIVRPLTFRVIQKAEPAMKESKDMLLESIDFELGYMGTKAETAAFGITDGREHKNLGMQKVDMSYGEIRTGLIDLVRRRHPPEETK
ncbi:MAG: hypothetical protein AAB074_15485 [Planctomycetota bacterium]